LPGDHVDLLPGGIYMASRGGQRAGLPFAAALMTARTFASGKKHGEIPCRGQGPVAGLAAGLEHGPHGICGRSAPDSSAVLPDVHADRHVRLGAGAVVEVGGEGGVAAAAYFPAQRRVG